MLYTSTGRAGVTIDIYPPYTGIGKLSILHSDTSWTFLKLNTLAGLVAILGHGNIIETQHFTPSYDVTIQCCQKGICYWLIKVPHTVGTDRTLLVDQVLSKSQSVSYCGNRPQVVDLVLKCALLWEHAIQY